MKPLEPIIIRVIDQQPTPELGIGSIILQALGLTGVIIAVSLLVGAALGALFIAYRRRQLRDRNAGEAGDQIRLRLDPAARFGIDRVLHS